MESENLTCEDSASYKPSILALPCLLWLPSFPGLPTRKIKPKLSKQYICKMCTYKYRKHVSTIKCNISLPSVPLEFILKKTNCNSMSGICADFKLNNSKHGGQICSVLQTVPLSKVISPQGQKMIHLVLRDKSHIIQPATCRKMYSKI